MATALQDATAAAREVEVAGKTYVLGPLTFDDLQAESHQDIRIRCYRHSLHSESPMGLRVWAMVQVRRILARCVYSGSSRRTAARGRLVLGKPYRANTPYQMAGISPHRTVFQRRHTVWGVLEDPRRLSILRRRNTLVDSDPGDLRPTVDCPVAPHTTARSLPEVRLQPHG